MFYNQARLQREDCRDEEDIHNSLFSNKIKYIPITGIDLERTRPHNNYVIRDQVWDRNTYETYSMKPWIKQLGES